MEPQSYNGNLIESNIKNGLSDLDINDFFHKTHLKLKLMIFLRFR